LVPEPAWTLWRMYYSSSFVGNRSLIRPIRRLVSVPLDISRLSRWQCCSYSPPWQLHISPLVSMERHNVTSHFFLVFHVVLYSPHCFSLCVVLCTPLSLLYCVLHTVSLLSYALHTTSLLCCVLHTASPSVLYSVHSCPCCIVFCTPPPLCCVLHSFSRCNVFRTPPPLLCSVLHTKCHRCVSVCLRVHKFWNLLSVVVFSCIYLAQITANWTISDCCTNWSLDVVACHVPKLPVLCLSVCKSQECGVSVLNSEFRPAARI
jgi:hypothetical protein